MKPNRLFLYSLWRKATSLALICGLVAAVTVAAAPAAQAQTVVIAAQDFNALDSSGAQTFDMLDDSVTVRPPLTNSGASNSGGAGLDFQAVWTSTANSSGGTIGPVTPSSDSSDFIGVNSFTGSNAPDVAADGTAVAAGSEHNFQFNDSDGRVDLLFESVNLAGYTNRTVSLDYWVADTGFESADKFAVTVADGVTTETLLQLGEPELEAAGIGDSGDAIEWTSVTLDLEPAFTAGLSDNFVLAISSDTNSGSENIFIDNISIEGVDGVAATSMSVAAIDADKDEGDSGTTDFVFEVARTGDASTATSVDYLVSSTDADAADFGGTLPSGTANFAVTEMAVSIVVPVSGDTDIEADEVFTVTLSNPANGETLATAAADGTIVNDDSPSIPAVFISELHYDDSGSGDTNEFIEVQGPAGTDLAGWSLVLYNGNGGTSYGTLALTGVIDDEGAGEGALDFSAEPGGMQNGNDGVALIAPGGIVADFISYEGAFVAADGPAAGQTPFNLPVNETNGTAPGQSLQLLDGVWVGPAADSPGTINFEAAPEAVKIHAIQGAGASSPLSGDVVTISGIVVGDFQAISTNDPGDEPLDGFFVQEEDADADADPATSEGIFVYYPANMVDVSVGDLVEVTGTVTEFFDLTELTNVTSVAIVTPATDPPVLPTPASPVLPTAVGEPSVDWEAIEGMSVTFSQDLFVTGMFPLGAFGEVQLSAIDAQDHPNQVNPVGSAAAMDQRDLNLASRVILDDGEDESESFPNGIPTWNPDPTPYLGGPDNTLRSGDLVTGLTGVVQYAWGEYEVHPVNIADPLDPDAAVSITRSQRPSGPPAVGGSLQMASFNVLNYFVTIDTGGATCGPLAAGCRGADTQAEFDTQSSKIATAIAALDADVVGLIEIENSANDEAIADLVSKVNALSTRTYEYVPTGYIGTDVIAVGFIYDMATVEAIGAPAILDSSVSPAFIDDKNRPVLAQTFEEIASGVAVTASVSHLKSKGSDCADVAVPSDPAFGVVGFAAGTDIDVGDIGDPAFTGNCNLTRTAAAQVLGAWMASDPTDTGATNSLILGDLNAYAQETPITALQALGYTDLVASTVGTSWAAGGHSYVFDGEHGTLDYAMANADLLPQVAGSAVWHINADEPFAIDYQNFNPAGQANPGDEFKSSDHDPVLVGLTLAPAPTCEGFVVTIDMNAGQPGEGTSGVDVVLGTPGDDEINTYGGDDIICAGDGNDLVRAGSGADTIFAGDGEDRVFAGSGEDIVDGGDGNDNLNGQWGDDIIDAGLGDDVIRGGTGDDQLDGNDGRDRIAGGSGNDTINGGEGVDKLYGQADNDTINGEGGPDKLFGGTGDDIIDGGLGNDLIVTGSGVDTVDAGPGNDRCINQNIPVVNQPINCER